MVLISLVIFGSLGVFLWTRVRRSDPQPVPGNSEATPQPTISPTPLPSVAPSTSPPIAIASDIPITEPGLTPTSTPTDGLLAGSYVGKLNLVIPVAGVRPDQLLDTFTDARSEGRAHDAIDIPASAGTRVFAAADGEIARLFQSERGGTTIYQLSPDKKLVFYYAHLQGYADGIILGKYVRQGEVIGYVGDTGNAGVGNSHLHFSITVLNDPKRYWEGTNINPYPLLRK